MATRKKQAESMSDIRGSLRVFVLCKRLPHKDKLILIAMCEFMIQPDVSFADDGSLSTMTNLPQKTIRRVLKHLVSIGAISALGPDWKINRSFLASRERNV